MGGEGLPGRSVTRDRLTAATLVALLSAGVLLAAGQQAPVVIRGRVESVPVPVTVFKGGSIVSNLTRDDFKVFDNNRQQPITLFEHTQQPLTAVLLMDVSESMTTYLQAVRFAGEQFVIRMRPGDRARVGYFAAKTVLNAQFTDDRDKLLKWIRDQFRYGNPTSLFDAVDTAIKVLAPEGGRRVIVLLTDGCDTTSQTKWETLHDRMAIEEIMIYAVQFRLRKPPPLPGQPATGGPCGGERGLPAETLREFFTSFADVRYLLTPTQMLDGLTLDTGGARVMINASGDINTLFSRVLDELHSQYLLAFAPPVLDGREHEIDVKVSDPKMVVRARRKYVALDGRAPTP